jgi:A/G-specific adenine glycosylase
MTALSTRLLAWYQKNARRLPWRTPGPADPYAVWVSEIMLQQTRVETVIPYFEKWMRKFPGVIELAAATEREVLGAWEGLGYYGRARNLHKAAGIVAGQYGGELPDSVDALRALPGIGRYTAGAIASIAFGLDEPALDGNLRRVYARLFDVDAPVDSPAGEKILWDLAAEHLPPGRAGDFNQALMDLGSAICLPKTPRCPLCPVMDMCRARKRGVQGQRPVRGPRKETPRRVHAAGVAVRRGRVLLARRPSRGLLGGMWEFPNGRVEGDPARALKKALKTGYGLGVRKGTPLGIVEHAYTHFHVTVYVFACEAVSVPDDDHLKWVRLEELEDYPMGRVDRRIAQALVHPGPR